MKFHELYETNCNWLSSTIVRVVIISSEGGKKDIKGKVSELARVGNYSEYEVISFLSNNVYLRNKEKTEKTS